MTHDALPRSTKAVNRDRAFDAALGARIRSARVDLGTSMSALGDAIGVSYQQVQKYELGRDRVSASTLGAIAAALNVHPGSFYSGDLPPLSGTASELHSARRLGERVARLRDPDLVRRLMALVDALAEIQDGAAPGAGDPNGHAADDDL